MNFDSFIPKTHYSQKNHCNDQSVTSRVETSRYRDFSYFFESIGISLKKFGLKKSLSIGLKKI